ncbi:MAG TPA: glycoside hydrolase family 16 protein [Chitinophagaceae bacterium]|nr:glycoside hydrolase family 16 protein [Chitinophagaceae bacterium]
MKLKRNIFLLLLLGTVCSPAGAQQRKLVWADEFNYTGLPDSTRWGYDRGSGCPANCGWGNNELQYYTVGRPENARVEGGRLIIEARREAMEDRAYTSARLATKHKGDWKYGRFEIRARLPRGRGLWPAIWMLPTDWVYGGWPASGEIDIMEFVGYLPDSLFGTVHTKAFNHGIGTQKSQSIWRNDLSDSFHVYAIDWTAERIRFLIDGKEFLQFANDGGGSTHWPFDQQFHLLLNVAVGGNWGGKLGVDDSVFPQKMEVDYVRIYQ